VDVVIYISMPFLSSSWLKMWTLSAESELLSMGHYVYSYTQRAASTSRSPTLSFSSRANTIDAIKYSGAKQGEINVGPGNVMDAGYNKTHLTAFNIYPSTRLCMHVVYIYIGCRALTIINQHCAPFLARALPKYKCEEGDRAIS
jgi:hypothetical protein